MSKARLLFLIGLIVGVGVVAGLDLSGADGANVSGGVPLASPNGPTVTVYGQTNVSLSDAFSSNAVNITSEAGNVTFSSPGATSVDVHSSNLTGTWTNVTAVTAPVDLTISPEDKQQVITNGSVSDLSIRNMTVDDGNTDFWINGTGTANITIYNLPTSTEVSAVENGTILDNTTTDASGVGTFSLNLSSHTISLQSSDTSTSTVLATGQASGQIGNLTLIWLGSVALGLTVTGAALSGRRYRQGASSLTGLITFGFSLLFWILFSLHATNFLRPLGGGTIVRVEAPSFMVAGLIGVLVSLLLLFDGALRAIRVNR